MLPSCCTYFDHRFQNSFCSIFPSHVGTFFYFNIYFMSMLKMCWAAFYIVLLGIPHLPIFVTYGPMAIWPFWPFMAIWIHAKALEVKGWSPCLLTTQKSFIDYVYEIIVRKHETPAFNASTELLTLAQGFQCLRRADKTSTELSIVNASAGLSMLAKGFQYTDAENSTTQFLVLAFPFLPICLGLFLSCPADTDLTWV